MSRKIVVYCISSFLLYLFLPVLFVFLLGKPFLKFFFLFYFFLLAACAFLFKRYAGRKFLLSYHTQDLQEKLNILSDESNKERLNTSALKDKISRYNSLKEIIEEINRNLELDAVANTLSQIAFSVIAGGKGASILYLVDTQTQKLVLFKTTKEDKSLIIRAKEGDIFDVWVARHASPLIVEDIKRDFRFDMERINVDEERSVGSLISAPFISEDKFLGILRLDNPQPHFYSQDDLRFLVTLCDIGAVAVENSQLFKYTQELATHDGLTSLYTKGYFLERLREECKRGVRKNLYFSLCMLDIDLFKNYNDKFGHTAGDIVLKKLSQIISEFLVEVNPVISRFGGEEFCIILLGADKRKACAIANQLRERIAKERIILRRQETSITVSIGIAGFPDDASTDDELIHKADKAMYTAKQKGRNQVCCI